MNSVSDTSHVTTNLQNDTSISDLDISVQQKEGLKCLYTNIDCISTGAYYFSHGASSSLYSSLEA